MRPELSPGPHFRPSSCPNRQFVFMIFLILKLDRVRLGNPRFQESWIPAKLGSVPCFWNPPFWNAVFPNAAFWYKFVSEFLHHNQFSRLRCLEFLGLECCPLWADWGPGLFGPIGLGSPKIMADPDQAQVPAPLHPFG